MSNSSNTVPSDTIQANGNTDSYAARNFRHWKRNLAICVFGSFSTAVSLTLLLPFLPLYVEQLGVTQDAAIIEWSGIAFGATFLGTGLTAPLWGYLADRHGRKPMLVRAAIGMAIIMPMIGLAHNVYELTLLRLAAGVIGGYASSATLLVATQTPVDKSGWALGVLSTGALAGTMIGPLIGGLLPSLIGIRNTFFLTGSVIAVAALVTIFFVKEDFVPRSARNDSHPSDSLNAQKPSMLIVASMFGTAMLVLFSNMSIEPIITIYLKALYVAPAHIVLYAGIVMAASAFGSILAAAPLGRLADRIGGWRVIIYCLFAASILMLPQAFVSAWWQLAVLRFLMGMALAGLLPSVAKVIRRSVPEHALGKVLGYSQSAQYAGQVLGPLAGGALGGMVGMPAVFFLTSGLLLCGVAVNKWALHAHLGPIHGG